MGPNGNKKDIYNVMTSSRHLANYCQESVKSCQNKKISNSLNNFHLKTSIDFITKSLTDEEKLFFEFNDVDFVDYSELEDKPIYNKVIDSIEAYLLKSFL